MQIIGIIGYVILIFIALTWAVGVRTRLETSREVIFVAFLFMVFAICIPVLGIELIYSWLFIIIAYLSSFAIMAILSNDIPFLLSIINPFVLLYAGLIRLGIPAERIQQAKKEHAKQAIENYWSKNKEK